MIFSETFDQRGIRGIDQRGAEIQRTTCPDCSHKRKPEHQHEKCLTVWAQKGTWSCAHCGQKGHLRLEGSAKPVERPKPEIRPLLREQVKNAPTEAGSEVFAWFLKRGITQATVERNRIKQTGAGEHAAICFPFLHENKLVNVKYRGLHEKKFWQTQGASKIFYGLDDLVGQTECVICEGEMDKLSFNEAGFFNVVSVPDGAPSPEARSFESKFSFLETCADCLEPMQKIYLACDADEAGTKLRDELARRLGKHRCLVVNFPENCKDANDVLVRFGAVRLWQCVEQARPYPVEGAMTVQDYEAALDDLYKYGFPVPPKSGFAEFDAVFHPFAGALTVVTGVPSHGKTTFLQNYVIGLAKWSNWRFAVYSPEAPAELWGYQACEVFVGKPFLPNYNGRMNEREYAEAKEFLGNYFIQLCDDTALYTIERLKESIAWAVRARGVKAAIIDPWNKVAHNRSARESEHEYIGRVLPELQLFAKRYGVHLFIVAHPTKLQKRDDFNFEIPTMYSISGSANWYNMPDNGLILYRYRHHEHGESTGGNTSYVFTGKIKTELYGRDGAMVKLAFNAANHCFTEATSDNYTPQHPTKQKPSGVF
jgi:twinkle protein